MKNLFEEFKKLPTRKTEGNYFFKRNYNPWANNINDCAIRAISAALAMKYIDVCKNLEIPFKNGMGLMHAGVNLLDEIHNGKLGEYFDMPKIVQGNGEQFLIPTNKFKKFQRMPRTQVRVNVNDFCYISAKYHPGNIYILATVPNKKSYNENIRNFEHGHAVAVFAKQNHPHFVDTWDCGDMLVYAYMRVKKQVPKNSPERINIKQFMLSQKQLLKQQTQFERIFGSNNLETTHKIHYSPHFSDIGYSVESQIIPLKVNLDMVLKKFNCISSIEINNDSTNKYISIYMKHDSHLADIHPDILANIEKIICKTCEKLHISKKSNIEYCDSFDPSCPIEYISIE